ncbi:MAG: hypothetical protein GC191_08085 [Azospirillum sp.]|nr:hypothetical protein [Azospirillum sp.]
MFTGAVPKPALEQITRVVDFSAWNKVFVGCSGSFRFERAVRQRHPGVELVSNDVSLLTCAIGALATGWVFPIAFTGRLAFVEDHVADFADRVAAVTVALEMAKYKGANAWAESHFSFYREGFAGHLARARASVLGFVAGLPLTGFHAGDFRDQVGRAAAEGGGVAAFPPTYKGGYERLYRFLEENSEWPAPAYEVWDPKQLGAWVSELAAARVPYCVVADHQLEGLTPVAVYRGTANKPVYSYADRGASSVRAQGHKLEPFAYRPVDPASLKPESKVELIRATAAQMNFLKDKYLAKGINHVSGLANYLVLVDGALAGGFIYAREKFGGSDGIYLLSDFAIVRDGRLSKLVAMQATGAVPIRDLELKMVQRITRIFTTAFTNKPVSMKYRGIFDLVARKEGMLNYAGTVRRVDPQAIYTEWFRRFHKGRDLAKRSRPC